MVPSRTSTHDLLDLLVARLPKRSAEEEEEAHRGAKVVFLGKPNVGKSSLMNELLQQERSIVSPIPGTTREAFSESVVFYKEVIELTDTPGIRKKDQVNHVLKCHVLPK